MFLAILTEFDPDILQVSTKNSVTTESERGGMMRKLLFFLLAVFFLTGCQPRVHTDVASHIVTEITITCQTCNDFDQRYYNTHKKMQPILLYLRSVSPGFTPDEDPEPLAGRVICITLYRADGTTRIYRQKGDLYLQEGKNSWKKIKPEWGATLYQIILENESDPQTGRNAYHPLPGSWQYSRWVEEVVGNHLCENSTRP